MGVSQHGICHWDLLWSDVVVSNGAKPYQMRSLQAWPMRSCPLSTIDALNQISQRPLRSSQRAVGLYTIAPFQAHGLLGVRIGLAGCFPQLVIPSRERAKPIRPMYG